MDREHARQEDYFALATITARHSEVTQVPCKVFLSKDVGGDVYISLLPNKEQYDCLLSFHQASLYAEINTPADTSKVDTSIVCNEMYLQRGNTRCWGPELTERSLEYKPLDIRITMFRQPSDEYSQHTLSFGLAPIRCSLL